VALVHGQHWDHLLTPYGGWWLVEVLGFVLLPALLFATAVRRRNATLVRVASVITVLGLVLNRLNVSLIAYRWNEAERYFPSWREFVVTLTIVTLGLLTFRWIVNRMPVLHDQPAFEQGH